MNNGNANWHWVTTDNNKLFVFFYLFATLIFRVWSLVERLDSKIEDRNHYHHHQTTLSGIKRYPEESTAPAFGLCASTYTFFWWWMDPTAQLKCNQLWQINQKDKVGAMKGPPLHFYRLTDRLTACLDQARPSRPLFLAYSLLLLYFIFSLLLFPFFPLIPPSIPLAPSCTCSYPLVFFSLPVLCFPWYSFLGFLLYIPSYHHSLIHTSPSQHSIRSIYIFILLFHSGKNMTALRHGL